MEKKILIFIILLIAVTFPITVRAQGFFDWVGDFFTDIWNGITGRGSNSTQQEYSTYDYTQNQSNQSFGGAQSMIWSQGECDQLEPYSAKLCNLLWKIQQILYAVGIGLAAIMIILGGITYMSAREDEEQVKKAKKMIINGLIGFAIVLSFALIMGLVRGIVSETLL